jgi:hypothetical protein
MKEKIEKYTRDVFSQRAKILDDFARAYLAERMGDNPNFKISDLELVEERSGNIEEFKATFFFRIKRGRKRKLV